MATELKVSSFDSLLPQPSNVAASPRDLHSTSSVLCVQLCDVRGSSEENNENISLFCISRLSG